LTPLSIPATGLWFYGLTDAVVGFADGHALLSQLTTNISDPNEYSLRHWQQNQWSKIAPNTKVGGIIRNALENLCQYDATQGKAPAWATCGRSRPAKKSIQALEKGRKGDRGVFTGKMLPSFFIRVNYYDFF